MVDEKTREFFRLSKWLFDKLTDIKRADLQNNFSTNKLSNQNH